MIKLKIKNMTCKSCAKLIESSLMEQEGISKASISYQKENAEIEFDTSKASRNSIIRTINDLGYEASEAIDDKAGKEGRGNGLFNKLFGRK